jgi:2-iminobutanoate/2-iminopropanoate deaminase
MVKNKINSNEFAERMGAYSHGYSVNVGDSKIIFTTGQIALDENGNVVSPDNIEGQTRFVYESLNKILNKEGATLDDAIKTTIYLTDMSYFSKVSKIRNEYLKNSEPVSTLVEVSKLVKPECKIEIEIIAVIKNKN